MRLPDEYLISKDAAIALIENFQRELCPVGMYGRHAVYGSDRDKFDDWQFIIDELEKIPAVDAAPVVHGRWIKLAEAPEWDQRRCTVCGDVSCCQRNYCPNCGAKMDGDGGPDGSSVVARDPLSESGREMPRCEVTKDG